MGHLEMKSAAWATGVISIKVQAGLLVLCGETSLAPSRNSIRSSSRCVDPAAAVQSAFSPALTDACLPACLPASVVASMDGLTVD